MKTENFRTIIVIHVIAMVVLSFSLSLFKEGIEKDVLSSAAIGFMVSLLIQFVMFCFKADWFESKIKKQPHEI